MTDKQALAMIYSDYKIRQIARYLFAKMQEDVTHHAERARAYQFYVQLTKEQGKVN